MNSLPFDPSTIDYATRVQLGRAPLSPIRLTVVGKSGARHVFNTYTFSPYFEKEPRHFFTLCGRFIIMRQRVEIGDETITVGNQYHVFYNGMPVPEERYAIRTAIREGKARQAARYKQSRGRDDTVLTA
jgi:hypothetical protein